MKVRSLSLDTKGLYFVVQILLGIAVLAGVWFAWIPVHTLLTLDTETASAEYGGLEDGASLASREDDDPVLKELLRYLEGARGVTTPPQTYRYVPETGPFISVDLVAGEVVVYEDGSRLRHYPILRTPAQDAPDALREGLYTVLEMKAMEVSTLALVRFPHYVRFDERFAVHGPPSDEQGALLSDTYVGGSVLLDAKDAAALYAFATTGAPLYVRTKTLTPPYAPYTKLVARTTSVPATSATAYAVADLSRTQVVLEKNAGKARPIASVTKLVTAAVASDTIGHGVSVVAPNGKTYTLGDLFYPLLLRSDNGVADHIASREGLRTFLYDMNTYTKSLGMSRTSFADPSGLSPRNVSSAYDLTLFARHLYMDKRYILDISKAPAMTITSDSGAVWKMDNQNKLAGDPHFVGGKLGFTDEAGQTSVAIFNVPIGNEVRTVSIVVLGSHDWKQDTRTLLRWLLENVELREDAAE